MTARPPLRMILVDDEPLARERARRLVQKIGGIEIVAEAWDGRMGLEMIERHQPDVVLLDVNMPEVDGLRMLEALDDPPAVVFSTAHEQYAVRAFELEAVDYLLKPYSAERLAKALERVRRQFGLASSPVETEPRRIPAENGGDTELIDPNRLVCARIESGVVLLLRDDGERLCFEGTLGDLEALLPSGSFLRANRQAIVNISAIEALSPTDEGGLELRLRGGTSETVSRRRARHFRFLLHG